METENKKENLFDAIQHYGPSDAAENLLHWLHLPSAQLAGLITLTGAPRSGKTTALYELCRVCLPFDTPGGENKTVLVLDLDSSWTKNNVINYFVLDQSTGLGENVLASYIRQNLVIVKTTFDQLATELQSDTIIGHIEKSNNSSKIRYVIVDSFSTGLNGPPDAHKKAAYDATIVKIVHNALETQKILQIHIAFTFLYTTFTDLPEDDKTPLKPDEIMSRLPYIIPELASVIIALIFFDKIKQQVEIWTLSGIVRRQYWNFASDQKEEEDTCELFDFETSDEESEELSTCLSQRVCI
ncbi:hypothetical protein B0I72DRAFT_136668 [Yarrowia lipolytica]|uniref:YALI0E18920p n=2 Tax=Yarrowia lipolytica TaxID=4952 RepID=Q6C5D7_YARLI|nr:YALI0E18920p [Yarrowia lipolytica CLIB122]AOW05631.1 hypothetical protein YALI1_E22697g [Yarrowia lipolytica]KAB8281565.1 hypothetical protein BKA91DRAFT_139907 [Yarrowia lipolytica]KAE8171085.1 hypothetical protein BKA90DRAFT_139744 [Yarrowia lipolytica]KAJ8057101.1 hypothetical protein LXG23DRAFT_53804 [Yarrowia lipolytica]QNQ00068.1 Hypothetical protein YALI2_E01383g [Yarrowia lipolytica]|eukprot:XP_504125.1 YALI0E18920p [Yarrowia lipolytica CLIB122]